MEYLLKDMDMHMSLGLGRRFHIPILESESGRGYLIS